MQTLRANPTAGTVRGKASFFRWHAPSTRPASVILSTEQGVEFLRISAREEHGGFLFELENLSTVPWCHRVKWVMVSARDMGKAAQSAILSCEKLEPGAPRQFTLESQGRPAELVLTVTRDLILAESFGIRFDPSRDSLEVIKKKGLGQPLSFLFSLNANQI